MSTTAAVLSIVGAGLLGWFGGFVLGIWHYEPPPRWVRLNVRVVDSGTLDDSYDWRLDMRAVKAPAAVQFEANDVRVDIWAQESE